MALVHANAGHLIPPDTNDAQGQGLGDGAGASGQGLAQMVPVTLRAWPPMKQVASIPILTHPHDLELPNTTHSLVLDGHSLISYGSL